MVANLYADIPEMPAEEYIQEILVRPIIRIERIVSRGHCSPQGFWYDQDWEEWVLLLQGKAGLEFKDDPSVMELKPGDHVLIAAHERHRVAWTARDEDTVWLAVHMPSP